MWKTSELCPRKRKVMVNEKAFDGTESEIEPRNVSMKLPGMDMDSLVRQDQFS